MDNEVKRESVEHEDNIAAHEKVPFSVTGDKEAKELYEDLCESLKGVIPDELYPMFTGIRPIEAAIQILMMYGGRIRLHNPEIDLTGYYDIPEETKELNDTIGSFKFSIPLSPFIAIADAVKGEIDADEEIIQSRDRKGMLPLVIEQDEEVKRMCLINTEEYELEITIEHGLQLDISLAGSDSEREETTAKALEDLGAYLDKTKQKVEKGPKLFDNPEEEAAILAWCEKHAYKPIFMFRASIDCWH